MRTNRLCLAVILLACGCSPSVSGPRFPVADGGGGGSNDLAAEVVEDLAMPVDPVNCDDTHPCKTGKRCYMGTCIPDNGTCQTDNDCQNDSYCDCTGGGGGDAGPCVGGVCVPWGSGPRGVFDPDCKSEGFSASAFKPPVEKCRWKPTKGEAADVIMTPIVIDLDGDKKPEIVFSNFGNSAQGLVAIHGADCSPYFELPNISLTAFSQLAAGDLDGDKVPEIVGVGTGNFLIVFDNKGNQLAKSPTAYVTDFQGSDCAGPAIADVDGDKIPEILVAGQVARYKKGQAQLQILWNKMPSSGMAAHWGTLSLFADLDGDGKPEAVTGLKVYDGATGADKTPGAFAQLGTTGAYPQIADFNGDKKPDILLVQSQPNAQQVAVVDYANNKVIFGPYKIGNGWGGPAVVADFDGDAVPDFALASTNRYFVYAMKCGKQNPPPECKGPDPGVLWERNTYDSSSGGTGSSVFDFNGDGKVEVVYRDECWLRVMNGPDGKIVFAQQVTSGTCLEMPVIVDVDNDGHADIVVPSDNVQGNTHCQAQPEGQTGQNFTGSTEGTFVLTDPMNRCIKSDPRMPNPQSICTTKTANPLAPGSCETVECEWQNPPQIPTDLWFQANDDGTMKPLSECKPMNDLLFLPGAVCMKIG